MIDRPKSYPHKNGCQFCDETRAHHHVWGGSQFVELEWHEDYWLGGKPVGGVAVDVAVKPPLSNPTASVGGYRHGPEDEAEGAD
jgi:hypothetical protein